jgi:hypothetical protein
MTRGGDAASERASATPLGHRVKLVLCGTGKTSAFEQPRSYPGGSAAGVEDGSNRLVLALAPRAATLQRPRAVRLRPELPQLRAEIARRSLIVERDKFLDR